MMPMGERALAASWSLRRGGGGIEEMDILDANAFYTYAIDFVAEGKGGLPVLVRRHNRHVVVAAVDCAIGSKTLAITDTVAAEVRDNALWAVNSAARAVGALDYPANKIVNDMTAKFDLLYNRFDIRDEDAYLEKVDAVYADIWRDRRMAAAIESWRIVKENRGKKPSRPALETDKDDIMILSMASHWAAKGVRVRLLTLDRDFTAFADTIRERLGVHVVDCGSLARGA